jgi:hypothetical protein
MTDVKTDNTEAIKQAEESRKNAEENRKKLYEAEKARADKVRAAGQEKLSRGKPTPTQEENDRAATGEYLATHEDDGSGPDVTMPEHPEHPQHAEHKQRQVTAKPGDATYQTRAPTKPAT